MTKKTYIGLAGLMAMAGSAGGGYAFAQWQDSAAAGFFMFFVLDALFDVGIALRVLAPCDHL